VVLHNGATLAEGLPSEVMSRMAVRNAYLGVDTETPPAAALADA
jgi:hypothetical protein